MEEIEFADCRGCRATNPGHKISDEDDLLKTKFCNVTTLTIANGYLCDDCVDVVNFSYNFRKRCLTIDKQLHIEAKLLAINSREIVEEDFIKIKDEMLSDDEDYIMIVVDEKDSSTKDDENDKTVKLEDIKEGSEIEIGKETYPVTTDHNNAPVSMVTSGSIIINPDEIITDIVEDSNIKKEVTLEYDGKSVNFIHVVNENGEPIEGEIVQYGDETVTFVADLLDDEIAVPEDGVAYTQEEIVVSNGDDQLILNSGPTELVILERDEDPITVVQQTDGSFLCDCGNAFRDFSAFKEHRESHFPYECKKCLKKFEHKRVLLGHTMLHNQDKPALSCPFCDEVVQRNILTTHIKMKHVVESERDNECGSCFKKFNSKSSQARHESKCENIDGKERYVCKVCSKEYISSGSLKRHMDSVHNQEDNKLLCSECGEILLSQKAMYTHLYIHKQGRSKRQKKYICATCGKGCPSHAMLQMHVRVHTGERPYKCTNCTLAFKTKTHLTTHQLTHTQIKQFTCEVCMKAFALKGNLVVHMRTHTGERPYICDICNQSFIDSKYLKKHKNKRHSNYV